jgi:hypothetical protein
MKVYLVRIMDGEATATVLGTSYGSMKSIGPSLTNGVVWCRLEKRGLCQ